MQVKVHKKDKMLYLKHRSKMIQNAVSATKTPSKFQNAVSATEMPFISCYNESNTSCLEMIWKVIFSWVFSETLVFTDHLQLKKTKIQNAEFGPKLNKNMDKI